MISPEANQHRTERGVQEAEGSGVELLSSGLKGGEVRLTGEGPKRGEMGRLSVGERQRAQRFTIQTALRYRKVGEAEWRAGTMVNISKSGVLFETEHSTWPNTEVEMWFNLPPVGGSEPSAQVMCHGVIARVVSEAGSAMVRGLAARITRYRFVRPGGLVSA